ncbi:hypothetical protein BJP37_07890 [Moorena bouillonii PNG]|uniref:Uncharacterized protein n=1 Tax=Moorena bouillonii PNG TaxID=568701 RepID=A0A1U7MZ31_9CYAN|nr:hypothetical protein BJP37_07890 [Moorena bouillonii PNG]
MPKRISEKFFDTEFCPPSPPTLGGTRVHLLLKVPQNWGTNGGLDVANETSQTTSKSCSCENLSLAGLLQKDTKGLRKQKKIVFFNKILLDWIAKLKKYCYTFRKSLIYKTCN